jgi:hypothetical protein
MSRCRIIESHSLENRDECMQQVRIVSVVDLHIQLSSFHVCTGGTLRRVHVFGSWLIDYFS